MNFLIGYLRSMLDFKQSTSVEGDDSGSANLTFEEENAVQYIGGYVVKKLQDNPHYSDFTSLLTEMVCCDAVAWTNAINRVKLHLRCIKYS